MPSERVLWLHARQSDKTLPIGPDHDKGVVSEHAGTVCLFFPFATWNSLATGRASVLLQPHREEQPFA